MTDHPDIIPTTGLSYTAAVRALEAAGEPGKPRVGRCGIRGTNGSHFVVWPDTANVGLGNMRCPLHPERGTLGQTVAGARGTAIAVRKDFVRAIAAAEKLDADKKAAELRAAGVKLTAGELEPGDQFTGPRRGKTWPAGRLKVIAVTPVGRGRLEVAVVGTAAAFRDRTGPYWTSARYTEPAGILEQTDPQVTVTVARSAKVMAAAELDTPAVMADELDDPIGEVIDLGRRELEQRREYLTVRLAAQLADARRKLEAAEAGTDVPIIGPYDRDRILARRRNDLERLEAQAATVAERIAALEARVAELELERTLAAGDPCPGISDEALDAAELIAHTLQADAEAGELLALYNAADPHCERCHGRGHLPDEVDADDAPAPCPCTADTPLEPVPTLILPWLPTTTVALRIPYVGDGADGARRSAAIDREEADTVDDPDRRAALLDSAARWDAQADELAR